MQKKHQENYLQISANRAIMPSYDWVFYAHSIFKHQKHGHINSPESFLLAEEIVRKYNLDNNGNLCHIQQNAPGEFFVVCVDPLALRVHEVVPQAADVVMVDATSNLDRQDCKFHRYLLLSEIERNFIVVPTFSEFYCFNQGFVKRRGILF